jgi:GDP/UDP-N,N'-diacetylbacillosamine 2-epimerase (hydrolysing)
MKKLAVLTGTRADFGLLAPIIKKLRTFPDLDVRLAVTGAHLSPEFGLTVSEIEAEGIPVDRKIEILLSSDTPSAISKSMGLAMIGFGDYFQDSAPDALLVLGDRYETLAAACAAVNARIPIFHLYGGETTEGAVDEGFRHALTKLSCIHFVANEEFEKRVIQLGEAPERVFRVGAMGPENAIHMPKLSLCELEESLGVKLGEKYAVLTFHPVTLENHTAHAQADELVKALERFPEITFLCTKANADADGRIINEVLEAFACKRNNVFLVDSLGAKRYLSALNYALFAIGNSSSGLAEVPSFHIPTVNIGDRQKGRMQGESIINCAPEADSIAAAIEKALSPEFRETAAKAENPYGDGHASSKIAEIVHDHLIHNKMILKKKFYDLE